MNLTSDSKTGLAFVWLASVVAQLGFGAYGVINKIC